MLYVINLQVAMPLRVGDTKQGIYNWWLNGKILDIDCLSVQEEFEIFVFLQ